MRTSRRDLERSLDVLLTTNLREIGQSECLRRLGRRFRHVAVDRHLAVEVVDQVGQRPDGIDLDAVDQRCLRRVLSWDEDPAQPFLGGQ